MKKLLFLKSLLLLCLSIGIILHVNGQSNLPVYTGFNSPTGASAPGDAFSPTMSGNPAPGTPVCAEWTRTAGPDESMVLTGINFTSFQGENAGKDTRFTVYGPNGIIKDAFIQRVESDKAVITIDAEMQTWSMYMIWPRNNAGYGKPIAVNKTEAWWIGPDKAVKGKTASVYGRNLSSGNGLATSHLYIKNTVGALVPLQVTSVNPYKVDFVVPQFTSNQTYEIWAHNGHGGQYGWSGPLLLTIQDEIQYPDSSYFNVKEDFGAKGDGITDDYDSIQLAINAASAAGSTVYFPPGTYMVSRELSPTSNTRWKGAGKDVSVIKCHPSFGTYKAMLRSWYKSFIKIEDLSFDANDNYKALEDSSDLAEPINVRYGSDIEFNNVNFIFPGHKVAQLDSMQNIFFFNCKFVGSTSDIKWSSNAFFDSCSFELTLDAEYALGSEDVEGISITNSTCKNYAPTSWGYGRFFNSKGSGGSVRHHYLANNTTTDLVGRTDVPNKGEQLLWEGYVSKWTGAVVSSTTTQTTLAEATGLASKRYAIIVKGPGLGQSRRIASVNGSVITLEHPWNLAPDNTSVIAISPGAEKIVVYKNNLDGMPHALSSNTAAAGIQPYGSVNNFIGDGNTINELRYGLSNTATQHNAQNIDPTYFNLFVNNQISNTVHGLLNRANNDHADNTPFVGVSSIGNMFRKNTTINTTNAVRLDISKSTSQPSIAYCIFEQNTASSVTNGVSLDPVKTGIESVFYYKNNLIGSGTGLLTLPKTVLNKNTYQGFSTTYSGPSLANVIEAPLHVVEISASHGGSMANLPFTLWNSGSTAFTWSASDDVNWLNVSDSTGTLQAEKDTVINLNADPAGLAVGKYTSTLSIAAGDTIKKYTIIFDVKQSVAPAVAITSPAANASFTAPGPVNITATASDADGTVSKVEFFADTTKLGESISNPYSYSWSNMQPGTYSLTAKATDNDGLTAVSSPVQITIGGSNPTACSGTGGLLWEYWDNYTHNNLNYLPKDYPQPEAPTGADTLTSFATPVNRADNYASRLRGYICPPTSGNYTFYISADDKGRLLMNTTGDSNTNKTTIAYTSYYTAPGQFEADSAQISVQISLQAGQRYYIEALHTESGGDDHLQVAWKKPGDTSPSVIPGQYLIPYDTDSSMNAQMASYSSSDNKLLAFSEISEPTSSRLQLAAYPNPFQQTVSISFSGMEANRSILQIYNLQGVLLKTLFNGKTEPSVIYNSTFDGTGYPSGTYLAKLISGKSIYTKLIVLNN